MEAFDIRALSFSYPNQEQAALKNICLSVEQGEFLVLFGPSGSGKSTLLRQLKPAIAPHGRQSGDILFEGSPLGELSPREQAARIGFVLQSPDNQIVTDKVWHELAFGPESLGEDTPTIRRRVAEMASFFGIQTWFYKSVAELSGGQKQLLNLASVMVMQPHVLILDEPTAQLDPIAAADFLAALGKINRELGTTIILSEHRLEEALPLSTHLAVMEEGRLLLHGTTDEVGRALKAQQHPMFAAMPAAMRIWAAVDSDSPPPVTVRDGRRFFDAFAAAHTLGALPKAPAFPHADETVIQADNVHFRYEKEQPDVVAGLSLTVKKGDFLTILGGNGTGKTTALKLIGGLLRPYRGEIHTDGSVAVLPQDPQTLFVKKTVREDLNEILRELPLNPSERQARLTDIARLCRVEALLERHPYDLSGGEQQRAALAKVLLLSPDILLLDEPTKGFDPIFKREFAALIYELLGRGVTVVAVSHDVEFCARYAQHCALFFGGQIIAEDTPRRFFSGNSFYTTCANRMVRHLLPQAVTAEDVIACCGGTCDESPVLRPPAKEADSSPQEAKTQNDVQADKTVKKALPLWRKLIAVVCGAVALAVFLAVIRVTDLTALVGSGALTALAENQLLACGVLIAALFVLALAVGRRSMPPTPSQPPKERRRLSKRTVAATVMILLLIPLTLFIGLYYLDERRYLFVSFLILLECMLPFFLVFEGRKPQARELVTIAVLCAVGVAGRAAFFMLPQFKPVMAVTVIAGVALGGETGFLVGCMTMLVSNFFFSQGPLTPWQMFAMGIIGFLAGVLFRKGFLRRTRLSLAVFGAVAAVLLYGGLTNTACALLFQQALSLPVLLSYYVTGLPMDLVQAAATAFFLWIAAEPMLEKLDRIKVKYGLLE